MERSAIIGAAVTLAASIAGPALAQSPGFHPLGYPAQARSSRALGLSANGQAAAGGSYAANGDFFGFSWTSAQGRNDFGLEAGLPSTEASAISGDGSTVVGLSASGNRERAFSYRGPGTFQEIAPVGLYTRTAATGVSGDGNVVVGRLYVPQSFAIQAMRWTPTGGVQPLGFARPGDSTSGASAISRDGSTIVGGSEDGSTGAAFAWRQGTGMVELPSLPNSTYGSDAFGVNFDGSVVVGVSGPDNHAAIWRNGQVSDLGVPAGFLGGSRALAVNDAGTVVVGFGSSSFTRAAIWTPAFGGELLSDYLARNGIAVPSDWTLLQATAVSADGMTIAGWGSNASTGSEGFVVTIPAPSSLVLLGAGSVLAARRRSRRA